MCSTGLGKAKDGSNRENRIIRWKLSDLIMNREIKEKVKSEYIRRVKKLIRSQLNGANVIAGINAFVVGIIRYGAGVLHWRKEELESINIKTRRSMTMNRSIHCRENVNCILQEKKEEKGLALQSLGKYLSDSQKWLLKFAAGEKALSEVEDPNEFEKRLKKEKRRQWLEKPLRCRFLKETENVSIEITWQWLKRRHLKKDTEAMACAKQKKAQQVNLIKHHIDGQDMAPICRLQGESSETVMHLSSGFPVLGKSKYQIRHDIMGKHIHWLLLK